MDVEPCFFVLLQAAFLSSSILATFLIFFMVSISTASLRSIIELLPLENSFGARKQSFSSLFVLSTVVLAFYLSFLAGAISSFTPFTSALKSITGTASMLSAVNSTISELE